MTNEVVKQYFDLHEQFSKLKATIDEGVKTVQDQYGHVEHEFERETLKKDAEGFYVKDEKGKNVKEKTKVKLNERVLWEEVYHLGLHNHQAVDFLRTKYPDIFKNIDDSEKLGKDIQMFEIKNLGFSFREMNGANLIKLVRALIQLEGIVIGSTWTASTKEYKPKESWLRKIWNKIFGI